MENFIVSARKYRPATFVSVIGQTHITSTLKNAISRHQLAHAYLFCGPRGVGKTTCARIFAKAINCLSPVDNEACGVCESCASFNEGRSFSIHELDAASNNSVDDIRSLTEQVRVPPQIGRYSVYIIDEVHMLSQAAFNAFLKTLEEPPAHAIFILATTEKHKILPTILSRCQIFDFNRIRVEDSVYYLQYIAGKEGITYDDESLHLIALKADGGMRDALSMFDKAVSFCGNKLEVKEVARTLNVLDYDTYFSATSLIMEGNYASLLLLFDDVLGKGFSGQLFMSGLAGHFRDLLMCKSPETMALLEISGSILERYKLQSTVCEPGFLFEAIALLTSIDGTLRTSSNQRLAVELGLMRLCSPAQKKNSDATLTSGTAIFTTERPSLPQLEKNRAPEKPATERSVETKDAVPEAGTAEAVEEKIEKEAIEALIEEQKEVDATQHPKPEHTGDKLPETTTFHSISGNSISDIMKSATTVSPVATGNPSDDQSPAISGIDPASEEKIKEHMALFLSKLHSERPRIAMTMRDMVVSGHHITVGAPNRELLEDIERNRTEILMLLASTANVTGQIDLTVTLIDKPQGLRPIKPEDKYNYLIQKNPLITDLKRELDLLED